MFGPKKGATAAYSSAWDFTFNLSTAQLLYYVRQLTAAPALSNLLMYRYHYTSITSRTTSYLLITFWTFFFFYGETLLLVVLNYSTPVDTITSASFFTIKQHVVFFLTSTSTQLTNHINFYIYFLTLSAFSYLMNYNYSYNYNYAQQSFLLSSVVNVFVLFHVFLL